MKNEERARILGKPIGFLRKKEGSPSPQPSPPRRGRYAGHCLCERTVFVGSDPVTRAGRSYGGSEAEFGGKVLVAGRLNRRLEKGQTESTILDLRFTRFWVWAKREVFGKF